MIAISPNDFTEMVNMGMRLEEGVREANQSVHVQQGQQQQPQQCTNHNNNNHHQNFKRKKGAPGHDIENCYPLKYEVQKLIKSGMVPFKDQAPNVKANLLPAHGKASVNMVDGCPGNFRVFEVCHTRRSLVEIHRDFCLQSRYMVNDVNVIVPVFKIPERVVIQFDRSRNVNRSVSLLVIQLASPIPYSSVKVVPYKYNSTMIENGKEVPLPVANSVVSIINVMKVTYSGRVFGLVSPKVVEDVSMGKKAEVPTVDLVTTPTFQSGESSGLKANDDNEVLRLIKRSEFNAVEQLLQTPSKISVLSLLMNSELHKEALQKVLEQAYMEHGVTVDQFDHIVSNITSCNNLSFCGEGLPKEGRNHNLALHILMNCKEDAISNVLVDTGSLLNVLPKSTLARLSYQSAPMSCLLGRPWIHEAGNVTSTLHQKLKFVKNGKLIIVGGEKAFLKTREPISSLKDTKEVIQSGSTDKWGRIVEVIENKNRAGLGFPQGPFPQMILKPIERNDLTPSPNFDFPMFEAKEENDDEEVSDELYNLLEHEEKTIHPFEERIELVNLGSDDDVKEVKIGSQLCPEVKKGEKGIEVDPAKVKAIQEMHAPRTENIKEYLLEPSILSPPVEGRPLIMYLTVLEESMGCVLGQHDESGKKEYVIYYLSKKFTDCETRYSKLEKTCCALAWAAKCLRQYMLNHTTWLISKMDPIKYIFEKPSLTGRISRW
ncbi:hypothetical protein KIW84_061884 [Lathyrus oleraceus]|uniref:Reverse transcriptase RNase H-like domain-containing protein n=1 Tax=Pisum sativum TaxID=3888 RepID=A0A9D5A7J4_PEA|nr:hypothetical protein KIW84_061884 [Pisum sativum]